MLQHLATSLLVIGLSGSAHGAEHLAEHPGDWTIDAAAAPGSPTSLNGLSVNGAKHEPYLTIGDARIMTITVRGTDGSTENLHPMGVGHWIDTVFVMDQDNNVICEHEFPEPAEGDTVLPSYTCPDALAEGVTSVTSYEHCNLHGLWVGPTLNVAFEVGAAIIEASGFINSEALGAKHEPFMINTANQSFKVIVLGTDGSQVNLHPQAYPEHYITTIYVRDGHSAVRAWLEYSEDCAADSANCVLAGEAASVEFALDAVADAVFTPYEHCNKHGLWVGAAHTVGQSIAPAPESTDSPIVGGCGGTQFGCCESESTTSKADEEGTNCPSAADWTAADLAAQTDLGDATKCYYAIFDGVACKSNGGVYLIDESWYASHGGGNFGAKAAPKGCGTVVENWLLRSSSHSAFGAQLTAGTDLDQSGAPRATFVTKYSCGLPEEDKDDAGDGSTSGAIAVTVGAAVSVIAATWVLY